MPMGISEVRLQLADGVVYLEEQDSDDHVAHAHEDHRLSDPVSFRDDELAKDQHEVARVAAVVEV